MHEKSPSIVLIVEQFNQKGSLKRHYMTDYGAQFNQKGSLQRHYMTYIRNLFTLMTMYLIIYENTSMRQVFPLYWLLKSYFMTHLRDLHQLPCT